jgi:putative protease
LRKQGKILLTSNVIARNTKGRRVSKSVLAAIELKPDALIVADPGNIGFLRKEGRNQELHLSVQANTTTG